MDTSNYYQYQTKFGRLFTDTANFARNHMFNTFMRLAEPQANSTVIDVGVTCQRRTDTNTFIKLYPWPENITAVGLEDGKFLEKEYPGITFVQGNGLALPFEDKSFNFAVSWAVVEHVGSRENQKKFISELARVSTSFFLTTPNRWFPVEFHTVTPFLHWLSPPTFRKMLKVLKMDFYASEETLNLMGQSDLLSMIPEGYTVKMCHMRLLGMVSNLVIYVTEAKSVDSGVNTAV